MSVYIYKKRFIVHMHTHTPLIFSETVESERSRKTKTKKTARHSEYAGLNNPAKRTSTYHTSYYPSNPTSRPETFQGKTFSPNHVPGIVRSPAVESRCWMGAPCSLQLCIYGSTRFLRGKGTYETIKIPLNDFSQHGR